MYCIYLSISIPFLHSLQTKILTAPHEYDSHSTRPPPRLRRLLTASRCLRFHSRVSSPRAASQRSRICASSSVRVNPLAALRTWPLKFVFFGKKNGKAASRVPGGCASAKVAAAWLVVVDADTGIGALFVKAGSFMSRSSSESRSR